jgi:hypothetical protein
VLGQRLMELAGLAGIADAWSSVCGHRNVATTIVNTARVIATAAGS